jgi:hypothetical protein
LKRTINSLEDTMNNRLAVSLIAASLLTSGAAFAQSTTVQGAQDGAGPVAKLEVRSARSLAAPWVRPLVWDWKFRMP